MMQTKVLDEWYREALERPEDVHSDQVLTLIDEVRRLQEELRRANEQIGEAFEATLSTISTSKRRR